MDDCHPPTALEERTGAAGTPADDLLFESFEIPTPRKDKHGRGPLTPRRRPRAAISSTSVHTLETNVGAPPSEPASPPKSRAEIQREARESAAYEKKLRQNGWGPELDGFATPPATPSETDYRHGWWQSERAELIKSLERTGRGRMEIERVKECGGDCWVMVNKTDYTHRISANTCRHRFCKPCAITRGNIIGGNLRDRLAKRRWEKFAHVVLTLTSTKDPLSDQITRIYQSFRKLRNYRLGTVPRNPKMRGRMVNWWKHNVRGGAAFCEVTLNDDWRTLAYGLWHVHLHLICESRWLDQADLKSLWKTATGDSDVVWVERIDSKEAAAAEVSKYAAKGIDSAIAVSPWKLDELQLSMRGRRLCFTFGSWRGFRLMETPDFDPNEWVTIGRLDEFLERSRTGDDRAQHVLALLARPPP